MDNDYYDNEYDIIPHGHDDLADWGDREAWEDAQAEMAEDPLNPEDDEFSDDPLYEDHPDYGE